MNFSIKYFTHSTLITSESCENLLLKLCYHIGLKLFMQAKLIVAFDRFGDVDFLTKSGTIVTALTGNVNYPEPWLPQISTLVELTNGFVRL
jgi:hypothetical protein